MNGSSCTNLRLYHIALGHVYVEVCDRCVNGECVCGHCKISIIVRCLSCLYYTSKTKWVMSNGVLFFLSFVSQAITHIHAYIC